MTEKNLKSLYYIEQRIKHLRYRLSEINGNIGLTGIKYDGMPHTSSTNKAVEDLIVKKCLLMDELNQELSRKLDEERILRKYIESIDDEEIKTIIELRYIHLLNWYEIGEELHMDRTTASKKLHKFLSK